MVDKQTSDERLLKLIEGESGTRRPGVIAPGGRKAPAAQLFGKFKIFDLKSKFKGIKISLFLLNRGLIAVAALLTLIFLYTLLSGPAASKANGTPYSSVDTKALMKLISGDVQGLIRKSTLNQDIKRDFFIASGTPASANKQEEESLDLTEETKHLKLVGIVWSQDPEVMIENTKDTRTYIFKKGEALNGEFKVKEITRTSVTLELATQFGMREYVMR